jgi:hypothetical protein
MIEGQQEENDDLGDGESEDIQIPVFLSTSFPPTVGEYDDPKAIKQGGVAERN